MSRSNNIFIYYNYTGFFCTIYIYKFYNTKNMKVKNSGGFWRTHIINEQEQDNSC